MRRAAIPLFASLGLVACAGLLDLDGVQYEPASGDAGLEAGPLLDAQPPIDGAAADAGASDASGCSTSNRFCSRYDGGGTCLDFEDTDMLGFVRDEVAPGSLAIEQCLEGCCLVARIPPAPTGQPPRALWTKAAISAPRGLRVLFDMRAQDLPFSAGTVLHVLDVENNGFFGTVSARSVGLVGSIGDSTNNNQTPPANYADRSWASYEVLVLPDADGGPAEIRLRNPGQVDTLEPTNANRPPLTYDLQFGAALIQGSLRAAVEVRIDNVVIEPL